VKILVTGGCGFIGSNFIHYLLREADCDQVVNLDALTYAGNPANLADLDGHPRYQFVPGNICDRALVEQVMTSGIDAVVHLAAESHVDRSILEAAAFVRTNVLGTQTLLDAARDARVRRFVQVSTDEVYGSLGPEGQFTEDSPLAPNSPYAASKAGADLLVRAYVQTYGLPAIITRAANNYGPYQFPEKLIPLMITNALADKKLPVYGDGLNVRDWIHVEDHCRGVMAVLLEGRPGEIYNIGGDGEMENIAVVELILETLGKPHELISYVEDRLGHDRRYAIDSTKIQSELGWKPLHTPREGIRQTVGWYLENRQWWEPLLPKPVEV
jgi:dTDP-glucose 4,6-dehydratase